MATQVWEIQGFGRGRQMVTKITIIYAQLAQKTGTSVRSAVAQQKLLSEATWILRKRSESNLRRLSNLCENEREELYLGRCKEAVVVLRSSIKRERMTKFQKGM